jgi:hypothetical protein
LDGIDGGGPARRQPCSGDRQQRQEEYHGKQG